MGALADKINVMIETILKSSTWTSAGGKNPTDNFIKELRGVTSPEQEGQFQNEIAEYDLV